VGPLACCDLLRCIDDAPARDPATGETAAVVASVSTEGILGANVGDSGAWRIAPGGVPDLTTHQLRKPLLRAEMAVPVPFAAP
jgi:hypothetical protein